MRYGKRNWKRFTLKGGDTENQGHCHPSFQEMEGGREIRCIPLYKQKADFCWENE